MSMEEAEEEEEEEEEIEKKPRCDILGTCSSPDHPIPSHPSIPHIHPSLSYHQKKKATNQTILSMVSMVSIYLSIYLSHSLPPKKKKGRKEAPRGKK